MHTYNCARIKLLYIRVDRVSIDKEKCKYIVNHSQFSEKDRISNKGKKKSLEHYICCNNATCWSNKSKDMEYSMRIFLTYSIK